MLFKALKFELKKTLYNKKNILYFFLLVLVFSLFCLFYKSIISLTNYIIDYEKLLQNNILMRDSYKLQYEIAYGIIEKPNNIMLPSTIFSMKEELKYQFLRYDYYVTTNTSVYDYINIHNPLSSGPGLEEGVFIYQMAKILPILLFLISILISNFYIFKDVSLKDKLFVQSDVSLKKIYFAKLILSLLFTILIGLIYCIIILLLVGNDGYYILVINEVVSKMDVRDFLIIKMIISLSNSLLLISICSTLYHFVKNSLYNFFASLALLVSNYFVYFITTNFIENDRKAEIIKAYFPFVNSHLLDYTLNDMRLWGIIFFNTILMIIIYNRKEGIKDD